MAARHDSNKTCIELNDDVGDGDDYNDGDYNDDVDNGGNYEDYCGGGDGDDDDAAAAADNDTCDDDDNVDCGSVVMVTRLR